MAWRRRSAQCSTCFLWILLILLGSSRAVANAVCSENCFGHGTVSVFRELISRAAGFRRPGLKPTTQCSWWNPETPQTVSVPSSLGTLTNPRPAVRLVSICRRERRWSSEGTPTRHVFLPGCFVVRVEVVEVKSSSKICRGQRNCAGINTVLVWDSRDLLTLRRRDAENLVNVALGRIRLRVGCRLAGTRARPSDEDVGDQQDDGGGEEQK